MSIPIRTIHFDDSADVARHDQMVALVERMLDLHRQLPQSGGEAQKLIAAQIEAPDREIDALVYDLYGLDGRGDNDCGGAVLTPPPTPPHQCGGEKPRCASPLSVHGEG